MRDYAQYAGLGRLIEPFKRVRTRRITKGMKMKNWDKKKIALIAIAGVLILGTVLYFVLAPNVRSEDEWLGQEKEYWEKAFEAK